MNEADQRLKPYFEAVRVYHRRTTDAERALVARGVLRNALRYVTHHLALARLKALVARHPS